MTRSTDSTRGRHRGAPGTAGAAVADPRNPGDQFLQHEIDDNRRAERLLIPKAILALVLVAVLVAIREVFFA
jgi:hypothetical protein